MSFKYDLSFSKPLMNAAGTLGFTPDPRGPVDLSRFGAFVTNPISLGKRTPAHGPRFETFAGGFLLHTGLPNAGLVETISRCQERWARSSLPIIVHLLGEKIDELPTLVRLLESLEGVIAIELGLPTDVTPRQVRTFAQAASGELPLILRLPLEHAAQTAADAIHSGASAVSLGAPRGALPARAGNLAHGRLYGPALFPQALAAVRQIALSGLPVIGAGGVYSQAQAQAMLLAGALAVQLDSLLWRGTW
jgi:dihydroorotate dehydrogenase (NAD+) catalytic subunit